MGNRKPNGFLMFVLEFGKKERAKGHVFKNGLRDVQCNAQCSREWQNLTPERKAEYNRRAKLERKAIKEKRSMSDVEIQKRMKLTFESTMQNTIESTVTKCLEFGTLPRKKFFLIHANWFYTRIFEDGELDYIPAEFAVAEFSLEFGVQNIYHEILRAIIPTGYRREAREVSEETHRLPWNMPNAEDRFEVTCKKLLDFLESNKDQEGHYPPLYTSRKINAPVNCLLKRLMDSRNLAQNTFLLYDIEILFAHLRNAALQKDNVQDCDFRAMAEYELIKDSFSFAPGLDCEFHELVGGVRQFCSKSNVQKWAFTICDYCCKYFGIQMQVGVHLPLKPVENDETESLLQHIQQLQIVNN